MKKIFHIVICAVAALSLACSDFDDSDLRERIDGYKGRIEALQLKAEQLAEQLADLSYLTNGNVIRSVSQDSDGKYVISYVDNENVEHTVVLATMDDIIDVPIIGVDLEDGVYYWTKTVDGQTSWLTDDSGVRFPVSGYTPVISVDENGYWTVNGQQVLDSNGKPVAANDEASAIFRRAELNESGNLELTLGNGTAFTLPVFNSLNLTLDADPVTTVADVSKELTVNYALSGQAAPDAVVAIAKAEGLTAQLDRTSECVKVSFGDSFESGKLIIMAYDLAENVVIRPLFFKTPSSDRIEIATAEQLKSFAAAVNAGGEMASARVVITKDIDLKEAAPWTPIGNGTYTTGNEISGAAFRGVFDGQGYTITNLDIVVPSDAASGSAWGLFGVLDGATIRNVHVGSGSSLTSTAAKMTAMGAVAGYAFDSTIENCSNAASLDFDGGTDKIRASIGGIAGGICASESGTIVKGCINYGRLASTNTVNTNNGGSGFSLGGVVGFADAKGTPSASNSVEECTNEGIIDAQATRTAGILATANKYTALKGCVNKGAVTCTDTKATTSRVAGIVSAIGAGNCSVTGCVNRAAVVYAVAGNTKQGYAAGIVGQTNDNTTVIDGCENYGTVLSDIIKAESNKYIGIICANTNKKTITISNCKVGGAIGPYTNSETEATTLTAQNFEQYIYFVAAGGTAPTLSGNVFAGDSAPQQKGIATADDLKAFRDAVNRGESTADWEDGDGVVNLLNDIDMADAGDWTPIGNATFAWASHAITITGNPFRGTFDGGGHSLKNLKLVFSGNTEGAAYGLFGVLDGATVRNLKIGALAGDTGSLRVSVGAVSDVGVLAGLCNESTVESCVNYVPMTYDGTCTGRVTMAMVGFVFCEKTPSILENLKNYGTITASGSGNLNAGATAIQCAGICGFSTNEKDSKICNRISYCDNYAEMISNTGRTSGIVAAANRYTQLASCVNHGDQLNTMPKSDGSRLGGIACLLGEGSGMTDCINNGNVVSTTAGRCGGLVSLPNHASNSVVGCANYGEIITDSQYRGVFFGYDTVASTWTNCIAGGKLGVYNGGTTIYDSYDVSKQESYLGLIKSGTAINLSNITYLIGSTSGGAGGDGVEPALRILFIGNSFTKDAVEHLPGMVHAAGIGALKMTHLYYGGRTIPEYADGYATVKDYTCYKYLPGTSVWLSYSGYSIEEVVKSEPWDIVCLQEHTGNKAAWSWNATEKGAIESLIGAVKSDNAKTPRFVYIMSQAYSDMDKIGSGSQPYKTFTTQSEMFDVIVSQARKILDETEIEQIIPTGTVLQNLRTSSLNNSMDLTRDGYHMDYGLSRYAAACAVFESIISASFDNVKLDSNTFRYTISDTASGSYSTPVTDENAPVALRAARYALATPFAVTNMAAQGNGIGDIDFEFDSNKE